MKKEWRSQVALNLNTIGNEKTSIERVKIKRKSPTRTLIYWEKQRKKGNRGIKKRESQGNSDKGESCLKEVSFVFGSNSRISFL